MSEKALKPKPQIYAFLFPPMQAIAKELGYNLLLHGSLNRDCDLVAIPWVDNPSPEMVLIQSLHSFLTGDYWKEGEVADMKYHLNKLPGGRNAYIIHINRGTVNKWGVFTFSEDSEFYLDISVTPLLK